MQDMLPQLGMLHGTAVQEDTGSHGIIKLFDVRQLPADPASRFKAVFQERSTWLLSDLQPYMEDLQVIAACNALRHSLVHGYSLPEEPLYWAAANLTPNFAGVRQCATF